MVVDDGGGDGIGDEVSGDRIYFQYNSYLMYLVDVRVLVYYMHNLLY